MNIANFDRISMCFPLDKYPRPADRSQYEGFMSLWCALRDEIATPVQVQEIAITTHENRLVHQQRWINHYENRLTYERAMLCDQEGSSFEDKWHDMAVGGKIKVRRVGYWLNITKVNKRSGKITSVQTKDPTHDDYFSNWKYTLEDITDYQAPEPNQITSKVVICNYLGEGFKEITTKEWNEKPKDYKSIREETKDGMTYKVRYIMSLGGLYPVYLSDKKVIYPPKGQVTPSFN